MSTVSNNYINSVLYSLVQDIYVAQGNFAQSMLYSSANLSLSSYCFSPVYTFHVSQPEKSFSITLRSGKCDDQVMILTF